MNYNLKNTDAQVKVLAVKKLPNTYFGNPMYELATDMGFYKTAANHNYVYGVPFSRLEGKTVLLTLGGRGTITNIEGEF